MRVMAITVLLNSLWLAGCGPPTEFLESVDLATAPADDDREAKLFEVPAGKASIYLYRDQWAGRHWPLIVLLDDWVAGQTGEDSYFLWHVEPGPHVIKTVFPKTSAAVSLAIDAEIGGIYYVRQEFTMYSRPGQLAALYEVDESTGREGVMGGQRLLVQGLADSPGPAAGQPR